MKSGASTVVKSPNGQTGRARGQKHKAYVSYLPLIGMLSVVALAVGCSSGHSIPPDVLTQLNSEDPAVRYRAAEALSTNQSPASVPVLIKSLNDSNRGVRIVAAEALGKWKSKETTAALILALRDGEMGVRAQAASALGEIGSKAAVEPLITLLETQNNKNVGEPRSTSSERDTEAAIWALRKITGNDFASDAQKWRAWLEGGK